MLQESLILNYLNMKNTSIYKSIRILFRLAGRVTMRAIVGINPVQLIIIKIYSKLIKKDLLPVNSSKVFQNFNSEEAYNNLKKNGSHLGGNFRLLSNYQGEFRYKRSNSI